MRFSKMDSYKTGIFSEILACAYLVLHGFRIVQRRYVTGRYTNRAEIDIIAQRRNLIVFIEVKHRKTVNAAWGAITNTQVRRLRAAAETYLIERGWNKDSRFDVIIVHGFHIKWIKNAF